MGAHAGRAARAGPVTVRGWCVARTWFAGAWPIARPLRRGDGDGLERCVDSLRFLDPEGYEAPGADDEPGLGPGDHTGERRCETAAECGQGQACVRPRADEALVALTMRVPPWLRSSGEDKADRTLVWQGARAELLDESAQCGFPLLRDLAS